MLGGNILGPKNTLCAVDVIFYSDLMTDVIMEKTRAIVLHDQWWKNYDPNHDNHNITNVMTFFRKLIKIMTSIRFLENFHGKKS